MCPAGLSDGLKQRRLCVHRGRADVCLRRPSSLGQSRVPQPDSWPWGHLPWVWPAVDPGQQPCSRRDWSASVGPVAFFLHVQQTTAVGQRAAGHRCAHVTWRSLGTEARTPDPMRAARLSAVRCSEAGPRAVSAVAKAALSPGAAYLGRRRVCVPQFWMTAPSASFGR